MKSTKTLSRMLLAVAFTALSACGGGGGSVSTGGVYFTHEQLAREFVNRAYTDSGIYMTLMKSDTLQSGYIVVEIDGYLSAVYIDGWKVGTDITNYIYSEYWYDVSYIGNGYYEDAWGYVYEETASSAKDQEKLAAVKQARDIEASAENIKAQFGLSEERSVQLARLAVQMKNNPKASMTDADYDSYAKEIIGSSITQINSALKNQAEGDSSAVIDLIDRAAETNNVGPEQALKIISMLDKSN